LLADTGAGWHAPTIEEVKTILAGLYQEYKLRGVVSYHGRETELNRYSHREMARKFAEVLDYLAREKAGTM
jgi:hypothetical protein